MRILITSIVDLRKTSHNRLHQFIKHLRQNHRITVLSINDWWKSQQADVKAYEQGIASILEGIEIKYFTHRILSPYLQEVFSVATLGRLLKDIDYGSFDVHLNYNTLISGYSVANKLKSLGIPSVYDVADDLPQMIRSSPQIPSPLRPIGGFVGQLMMSKNIRVSSRVTFSSNTLKSTYHLPEGKSEHIPNGVDAELFQDRPCDELRGRLGLDQDFVLGYVGVLREWVDFEPVFSAVAELDQAYPDIKLLIVGEEGLEGTRDLAEKYDIQHRVVFASTVPYTQVPQYLACMDACLIPHKVTAVSQNMLPLKLFEYMACHKPVISAPLNGVTEAAGDRVLYASSEIEYQRQIIKLYSDKGLRQSMGSEGRRFVEENYSWGSAVSKLEKVLEEATRT